MSDLDNASASDLLVGLERRHEVPPMQTWSGRTIQKSKLLREMAELDRENSEQKALADIIKARNQVMKTRRQMWEIERGSEGARDVNGRWRSDLGDRSYKLKEQNILFNLSQNLVSRSLKIIRKTLFKWSTCLNIPQKLERSFE